MSAAAMHTAVARKLPRHSSSPTPESMALRILEWVAFVSVGTVVALGAVRNSSVLGEELPDLVAWLGLVIVTDILPVPLWGNLTLALSLPLLLAAGMLYPPPVVGLLALIGSTDLREINREVSIPHGLYNRSQIAMSAMAASWVFHMAHGDLHKWPLVLGIALLALVADFAVNIPMVLLASRLLGAGPFKDIFKEIVEDLASGQPLALVASYLSFALVAVLLGVVYDTAGDWGLIAFVTPIFLARQVFVQSRRLRDMASAVSEKSRMLLAISERISEERRDERLAVAAGLHDEVLPPLYKVHLLGQVIRQDLASGRLLALEDDIPDLLRATENASDAMRILIRDLRGSSLGPGGLAGTLRLLVRHLELDSTAQIHLEVESVGGSPVVQLLTYQVAREALRNAIRHAHASHVRVSLSREGADMRLVVEDDGQGFDRSAEDKESHFGLQLMQERVELAGGVFRVTSFPGQGTQVVARLPAETTIH